MKAAVTYAGHSVGAAVSLGDEPVAYFPCEYWRTVALESDDVSHHVVGGHARLAAADRPRTIWSRLVEPAENLADATVRHLPSRHSRTSTQRNSAVGHPQFLKRNIISISVSAAKERFAIYDQTQITRYARGYCDLLPTLLHGWMTSSLSKI